MVYRKGELSKAMMDREWPHQVALPAFRCHGHNYLTMRLFWEPLSLYPRPSCGRDDGDMTVFCFAERRHAEQFRERFGGECMDPGTPPKWPRPRTRRFKRHALGQIKRRPKFSGRQQFEDQVEP